MKKIRTLKDKLLTESTKHHNALNDTITIYDKVISFLCEVCYKEFDYINQVAKETEEDHVSNIIETLIHKTKDNPNPKYKEFDTKFYKLPSYLRRSAIMDAFGHIKSYFSNFNNTLEKIQNQTKYKYINKPTLNLSPKKYPVLYREQNISEKNDNTVRIKVFMDNDWVWIKVKLQKNNNLKTIGKMIKVKELNPTLVKRGNKFFLHYPYQHEIKLNNTEIIKNKKLNPDFKILAVDLGINVDAVCSTIDVFGTVHDKSFIKKSSDKDRVYKLSEEIALINRESGKQQNLKVWRKAKNVLDEYAQNLANDIVKCAKANNVSVIVMEYLGKMRVPKNFYGASKLRFKLHFWHKTKIYNYVLAKAHREGIRVSRINPKNTSALSYTGTGFVERSFHKETAYLPKPVWNKNNVLDFNTVKTYNADLNASYNIGSKYFMRFFNKTFNLGLDLNKENSLYLLQRFSNNVYNLLNIA